MGVQVFIISLLFQLLCYSEKVRSNENTNPVKIKLPGFNAFIEFKDYRTILCTVPKVGSTSIRQWVINLASEQLQKCIYDTIQNNTIRNQDPACKSLDDFRNLTRFKKSGMTKFKYYCRRRLMDPSEFLFGKERCMARTANFSAVRLTTLEKNRDFYFATFVRHPVDRFISWFVDKAVMDRVRTHIPKTFNLELLNEPNYGVHAMLKYLWKRRDFFRNCSVTYDNHYLPQNCACLHKTLQYNFVGKLENMRMDWSYFVDNLARTRNESSPNADPAKLPRYLPGELNKESASNITRHIRQILNMTDLQQLYEVYIDDFKFFKYDVLSWYQKYHPEGVNPSS